MIKPTLDLKLRKRRTFAHGIKAMSCASLGLFLLCLSMTEYIASSELFLHIIEYVQLLFPALERFSEGSWNESIFTASLSVGILLIPLHVVLMIFFGPRPSRLPQLSWKKIAVFIFILWPIHALLIFHLGSANYSLGTGAYQSNGDRVFIFMQNTRLGMAIVIPALIFIYSYLCWVVLFAPVKIAHDALINLRKS